MYNFAPLNEIHYILYYSILCNILYYITRAWHIIRNHLLSLFLGLLSIHPSYCKPTHLFSIITDLLACMFGINEVMTAKLAPLSQYNAADSINGSMFSIVPFKVLCFFLLGYNKIKHAETYGVRKVHVIRKGLLLFGGGSVVSQWGHAFYVPINHHA